MNDNQPNPTPISIDALIPADMAKKAETVGVAKANLPFEKTFVLAILAGAFIGMGAIFATTATAGTSGELPFGITKLISGLVFCLGLILVIVGGAELFTGNNLIVMACASGRITMGQVLRNWVYVYVGNFVGSVATAIIMFVSRQYSFGNGAIGLNALSIANGKCGLDFVQAIALGMVCNALVCMAVWMCFGARSTTDKILAIIFPISAFVAAGSEHSVANMYFIPIGLFVKSWAPASFWDVVGKTSADFGNLTWPNFLFGNLLPVTIGNIIGGAVMVGLVYWFVYVRQRKQA